MGKLQQEEALEHPKTLVSTYDKTQVAPRTERVRDDVELGRVDKYSHFTDDLK